MNSQKKNLTAQVLATQDALFFAAIAPRREREQRRPVDLVSRRGIENSHNRLRRQEILGSAKVIYVASR